jgi:putative ABC transport system permease protein
MDWRRRKREQDLERELRNHLELEAGESGHLSPEEAGFAARRALGNTTLIREATREAWGFLWIERLAQDLRYAARSLRKNPGFAAVAIFTASLGIGANTSIFSIVDAVLLRPLPYKDAARLVSPTNIGADNFMGLMVADFQYGAWREQAGIFDGIAAYTGGEFTITGGGEPERIKAQTSTAGYLRTLGVAPAIGRGLTDADAGANRRGGQVAVITHAFWMRRFGGDPEILSRTMTLDGKPYSIAGVLPRGFEFPGEGEISLLVAFREPPAAPGNGTYFYAVIARLKRGVTPERAEADLAMINQRLQAAYPKRFIARSMGPPTRVITLHDRLVGNVRPALLALAGAVALVLLIVCVNVSNLLLARAIARRKEIAVRLALGAGRARVLRQLLTEGMLLAALGAAGGLAIAFGGVGLLRAIAPAGVPHVQEAGVGGTVLAFNLAIAMVSGLLFGLAPLRGVSALDPEAALKQTARVVAGGRGHRRIENLLIVSETAFALILLAGAGLLLRTFASLTAIAPGFQPANVVVARVSPPYWKYNSPERQRAFRDELLERARSGPAVDAVGAVACLPYGGFVMASALDIDGKPAPDPRDQADNVVVNFAAGDYFRTLGIPIREGRALDSSDATGRPAVAVVSEALARRFFAGESPIGVRIRAHGVTDWLEIVGVAGSVKQVGLASDPRPEIWQSASQSQSGFANMLAVRSTSDPRALIPWLRAQIAELDHDLPPPEIETMPSRMASLMASQVFVLRLLGLFAAIAVLLAAIGIYSVLAYSVERRAHEIGIRLALGASRRQIMSLVVGRGLRLSIAGSAAGVAGGLALTRYLKTLLYGVTPHDPVTLGAGCALVVLVALCAAFLPARRAVDQDAAASLRAE